MGSHPISEQEYPRFSDREYARRRAALGAVMQRANVDHLLTVTDHRSGNAPQWVTGWPGTVEAYVIFQPGTQMTMHVEWYNHFPLAKRIAKDVDVRWGEHRGIQKTIEELKRRGAKRVGLIGPLVSAKVRQLEAHFAIVLLDGDMYVCGSSNPRRKSSGCGLARRSATQVSIAC